MTVSRTTNRWAYAGNGVTLTFAYENLIFAATDLKVYVDGVLVTTGYSVTGVLNKDGGNVVFVTPPAEGASGPGELNVVIVSDIPVTQPTAWQQITDLPSTLLERSADHDVRILQQLNVLLGRVLRQAPSDPASLAVFGAPLAAFAGRVIVIDDDLVPQPGAVGLVTDLIALYYTRINSDATSYELRSPAQVRSDIGADNASNLTSGTVATARLAAVLQSLIGLASAANKLPYFSGADTFTLADFTAAARSLVDDADAPTMLTTLGAVPKAGGTMTGALTLAADPASALQAATKQYVDTLAAGLKFKQTVRAATAAAGTLASSFENGDTIDGVVLVTGDRILVKDQAAAADNGIYIVAASGAPARASDADSWGELVGAFVIVEEGTANADTGWLCTGNAGGTLGVTSVAFSKFLGANFYQPLAANLTTLAALSSVANLSALAGLSGAADKLGYFSGAGALALADLTSFARTLIDDANAAAARTTLGLGTIATQDASSVSITGGTLSGAAVTLPADPDSAMKAATKQYVDGVAVGLGKRGRVRAASTANLTLSGAQTIDGVACVAGDLVLAKNQTTQANNGIYAVAAGAWSRDANYDTWVELEGCLIAIEEGTTQADTLWLCTANSGGTIDVTAATFSQIFPGSGGTVTNLTASNGVKTTSGTAVTSTGNFEIDVSGLTADASPDLTADYVPTYDTSAAAHKKILLNKISPIPSGTAMLFQQTSAPTGWTKQTTHNDKALRVVSGTASSGGSTAFSSVFASRTPAGTLSINAVTLTTSHLPAHGHVFNYSSSNSSIGTTPYPAAGTNEGSGTMNPSSNATSGTTGTGTVVGNSTGGGSSFTPTGSFTGTAMDFAVQYVDLIIATKD